MLTSNREHVGNSETFLCQRIYFRRSVCNANVNSNLPLAVSTLEISFTFPVRDERTNERRKERKVHRLASAAVIDWYTRLQPLTTVAIQWPHPRAGERYLTISPRRYVSVSVPLTKVQRHITLLRNVLEKSAKACDMQNAPARANVAVEVWSVSCFWFWSVRGDVAIAMAPTPALRKQKRNEIAFVPG